MGTDIHGVVQVRYDPSKSWYDKLPIEGDRNYFAFAILGGVRNGSGLAGVLTHQPIRPIQENRGLPADFVMSGEDPEEHIEQGYSRTHKRCRVRVDVSGIETEASIRESDEVVSIYVDEFGDVLSSTWMGDHSHGWVTLAEWFDWRGWGDNVRHTGIVSRQTYTVWRDAGAEGPPDEYCGGISGPDIVVWSGLGDELPNWTHRQVTWIEKPEDSCRTLCAFMRYLDSKWGNWPGRENVRLVFGFDS